MFYTKEEMLLRRIRGDFSSMRALAHRYGIHSIYWGMREKGWSLSQDAYYGIQYANTFLKLQRSSVTQTQEETICLEGGDEWWRDLNEVLEAHGYMVLDAYEN